MDFFHSMEYVYGRTPYETFHTLYPPLANLFYFILVCFVPRRVADHWARSYESSVGMRKTALDLRTERIPILLFVTFVGLCLFFLIWMTRRFSKSMAAPLTGGIVFGVVFNYGVLYAVERGNLILLVLPLCLFYFLFYRDERTWLSEAAVLCLAIAAGLKLYPAVFGLLLLKERRFAQAGRAIVYGLAALLLPFLAFHEGFGGLSIWIKEVVSFGNRDVPGLVGNGFVNGFCRIGHYLQRFIGLDIGSAWVGYAAIGASVLLLVAAFFLKKEWSAVFALTLAAMGYSPQADYIYALVLIPLLMLLRDEDKFRWENTLPYLAMMIMSLPLPLFYETGRTYPHSALCQAAMLLSACWCLYQAVKDNVRPRRESVG